MRDFINDESNFNNFVATNDERRFFHSTPLSSQFFYREELFVFVGKTNDDESCSQKKIIQQSYPSHQARGKDYVKVY